MILLAAGAIGLAITRGAIAFMGKDLARVFSGRALQSWDTWRGFLFGPDQVFVNATRFGNLILFNFLPWRILATILIRLRRPRPPLKRLFQQPGFLACASPVLAACLCLVLSAAPLPRINYGAIVATTVPLSWLFLRASGQWRPEPGWIERLGQILGILFTVSAFLVLMLTPV